MSKSVTDSFSTVFILPEESLTVSKPEKFLSTVLINKSAVTVLSFRSYSFYFSMYLRPLLVSVV